MSTSSPRTIAEIVHDPLQVQRLQRLAVVEAHLTDNAGVPGELNDSVVQFLAVFHQQGYGSLNSHHYMGYHYKMQKSNYSGAIPLPAEAGSPPRA